LFGPQYPGRWRHLIVERHNEEKKMKKLITAIAAAAIGIVSLASPAHADERHEYRDHAPAPYSAPRVLPAPRATPVHDYRAARWEHERWEAERARERRLLEERRAQFYSHRHNRRERARFEAWYADRCHDLDRGLHIDIAFPF
jgi:hypothetical protein